MGGTGEGKERGNTPIRETLASQPTTNSTHVKKPL
jgi:hypothetical protein